MYKKINKGCLHDQLLKVKKGTVVFLHFASNMMPLKLESICEEHHCLIGGTKEGNKVFIDLCSIYGFCLSDHWPETQENSCGNEIGNLSTKQPTNPIKSQHQRKRAPLEPLTTAPAQSPSSTKHSVDGKVSEQIKDNNPDPFTNKTVPKKTQKDHKPSTNLKGSKKPKNNYPDRSLNDKGTKQPKDNNFDLSTNSNASKQPKDYNLDLSTNPNDSKQPKDYNLGPSTSLIEKLINIRKENTHVTSGNGQSIIKHSGNSSVKP